MSEELTPHTGDNATSYTRREFLGSVPATAVAGAVVAGVLGGGAALSMSGCGSDDSNTVVDVLTVAESDVTTLDAYAEAKRPKQYYEVDTLVSLDDSSMLFSSDGKIAAVMATSIDDVSVMNTISLFDLSTGEINMVLEKAVGSEDGYELYSVSCNSNSIIWVESNYLTDQWKVYTASVNPGTLTIGSATELDHGNKNYDAPEVAVAGNSVYWIVQPSEDGNKTTEDSYLKSPGGNVIVSHGRFNGGMVVNNEIMCCMPRADADGVHYQMTAVQNGAIMATQVLPQNYRPSFCIYLQNGFAFGIAGSYDYGDGIANMGTYIPLGNGKYLRLIRQPVTAPGTCNGWIFSKSGSRTVFVDVEKQRYFVVNEPSNSEDYGDYSVQFGDVDDVINYSTVSKPEGKTSVKTVEVRRITLENIS